MNRWQPLGLVVAVVAAIGLNHLTKARVPYELASSDRTLATGSLAWGDGDAQHAIELAAIHVVALDVPRVMGPPLIVRELWLRSPEQSGQGPDLELFVEFGKDRDVDPGSRSVAALTERDLPLLVVGRGTDARSRVRLPGASAASLVSGGSLRIARAVADPSAPGWHVEGDLDLTLRDGGVEHSMHAKLSARLIWN